MTSLDPTHAPQFGWKPQPRSRGEAIYDQPSNPLPLRTLPDLRFEQGYLLALKPFVHIQADKPLNEKSKAQGSVEEPAVESTALAEPVGFDIVTRGAGVSKYGIPERVEWGNIAWVTIRDQVISPLVQGAVWGSASIFLGPASKKLTGSLREMFVGPVTGSLPSDLVCNKCEAQFEPVLSQDTTFKTMGLLSENDYEAAPPELKLEQVHVYVRHGERTPVGIRMADPPANIPAYWNLCKTARRFKAAVMGDNSSTEEVDIVRLSERGNGDAQEGECLPGELTDVGRKSTLRVGQELRKLYVERLGLLPDVLDSHDTAYFRQVKLKSMIKPYLILGSSSTNMPRTIESLQQVLHGLYPESKIRQGFAPHVRTRHPNTESLIGNTIGCGRLAELALAFNLAAAKDNNPNLEQFDSKLSKYIGGNPIRIDGKPRLSGILDTLRAADAHGFRIPPEFNDPNTVMAMETAVCDEWFRGYKDNEFRRLAMGRLLAEMSGGMSAIVNRTQTPKIRVLACHDTTLAGLCQTLDVFNNRWPDFTASITFELFSEDTAQSIPSTSSLGLFSRKPATKHFVRMRYQNRNLVLPACAAAGDHLSGSPEFCTLAAFQEHVQKLTPGDWEKECIPKKAR
ncbi:histidine phosphatase family containing protein [Rhizoctonia solani]|uniref:Histidine phosphatase family containing protein n=1 Tax=Rhizoctonia solani TaxID=456999 RepID=A0A8H8P2W4_9AGAM|nr:histidine phosphatase family containing protein [Rhizoctonia solani]QRW23317.1 histidine phosphatase family containing protein [Rhizoctonia solani]